MYANMMDTTIAKVRESCLEMDMMKIISCEKQNSVVLL
jgi:hypothetical protein